MSRIALFVVCGLIVVIAGCQDAKQATGGNGAVAKKVYDREELRKAVVGKTEAEVKALLGVPDRTRELAGDDVWVYPKIARDPITGKIDSETSILFTAGKVTKVAF